MEELVKPDDLVLVSNRYEAQMCAIDCGARAIIVCCGSAVPRTIVARAQEKGCAIRAAVKEGKIQKGRHDSYIRLYAVAKEFKAWEKKPGRPIK